MDIFEIIVIFAGLVGIVGVAYTVYYGRKKPKKKLLVYENSISIPLAQAFSPEDDYKLSVVFQRKGSNEERIESVYTTFLKFANLGREPIRGSDIAPANPIKVKIEGARTLDIQIAGISREVNNVYIRNQVKEDTEASAEVCFDFLDYQDGALVKILTVGNKGKISLSGDIIGMPEGIRNIEETSRSKSEGNISGWVVGIVFLAVLALCAFIHYWVTGSWNYVWLILVPWGALIFVAAVIGIAAWAWPSGRPSFPKSLDLPKWCRSFPFYPRNMMMRAELLEMRLEEKTRKMEEENESIKKQINELKSKK